MGLGELLNQGKDIANGHINEILGLNEDISEKRMKICRTCPLFKKSFGGLCNPKLWLNPTTMEVSTHQKSEYYKGCGCRLLAKTRLPYASCPAKRW